ncbi:hypothetical protein HYX19_04355 [Candidatus Woesearchaeota archaeon]|nr:hypothetical protein [Candidatus Woesearchaeota archaeon]
MKSKTYFILILIALVFIVIGCSSRIQEINKDTKSNVKTVENISDYPVKQPEIPKESSDTGKDSSDIESSNKTQVKPVDKEIKQQVIQEQPESGIDSFAGASIDANKYSIGVKGPGSITQDNKIIMMGNARDDIIWNVLYTKQKIAFDKDFTISADVDLTADVVTGDAALIIGVEKLVDLSSLKHPRGGYCELSKGDHGKVIRTASSGAEVRSVPQTTGKMTLSYNSQTGKLTCSFNSQKIVENQLTKISDFVLTLRSGLHSVTYGWRDEFNSGGNFTAVFDNLNITQK